MSRRTDLRSVDGIFLLDKASGMTSNAALQRVKRVLKARKAGHTGSLDPLASGLLPICLGEATKLSGFLLNTDKRYQVTVRLGITTRTGDSEGEVIETSPVQSLSQDVLEQVLSGFRGEILQVPPMYSALKHQGRRLYDLARQGIEVEREPRRVVIHELRLLNFDSSSLELDVECSKGTYIRTLAEDIGKTLGCGGHVQTLRRTGVGDLSVADSHTLDNMESLDEDELGGLVLPMDRIVSTLPAVQLSDELGFYVRKGQAVLVPKAPVHGWVRLYAQQSVFMGVGEILDDGRVTPRRLVKAGLQGNAQSLPC
ncbi:tRNA pseudouridine(55) synthase TruB [Methylocaldum sp.]|uniref:tRNA pseudouridine(55) synthase TruB n=1 Tax=Methylocaldum sp. TaxID=1969727 RepID=UPI002D5567EE|nr:tRNA pseudouridine(55) synthase TruB [Methylocaldum sp.]HYE35574.1 tRNA pseudouridine(55) synthase TruB [Methylocaldum sp.]